MAARLTADLSKAFENFKTQKQRFKEQYNKTLEIFDELGQNVRDSPVFLTTDSKSKIEHFLKENLSLLFVGQTNCGKSSLINQLLFEKTILAAAETPCTARMVRFKYGDKPCIRIIAADGTVLETHRPQKAILAREFVELSDEDRRDEQLTSSSIEAELPIPFLASGVEVIDTPGRNENKALDEVVDTQLNSVLPIIVYVIDGRKLITNQDCEDLEQIKHKFPTLPIFYVVTKIDPDVDESDSDSDTDESDSDSDSETEENYIVNEIDRKKKEVFNKLKAKGILDETDDFFHSVSALKLKHLRTGKGVERVYKVMSDHLKSRIMEFVTENLTARFSETVQCLQTAIDNCLDNYIKTATKIRETNNDIEQALDAVQKYREMMHQQLKEEHERHKDGLDKIMSEICNNPETRGSIVQEAIAHRTNLEIPEDNVVAVDTYNLVRTEFEAHVLTRIRSRVLDALKSHFENSEWLIGIKEAIDNVQETQESIEVANAIRKIADSFYKANIHVDIHQANTVVEKLFAKIMDILRAGKRFFRHPIDTVRGLKHIDEQWKRELCEDIFNHIDTEHLKEEVRPILEQMMSEGARDLNERLDYLERLWCERRNLSSVERKAILQFAPKLAHVLLFLQSDKDKAKYGIPLVTDKDKIGEGGQAKVYKCPPDYGPVGVCCAVKEMEVKSTEELTQTALEVYHSRQWGGRYHLLPLLACIVCKQDGVHHVYFVTELMKTDLAKALPDIKDVSDRLRIAIDVAGGLEFLHRHDIIHRDIKPQNILLDEENQVYIADFGLCKPVGLAQGSLVGTPFYMGPEVSQLELRVKLQEEGEEKEIYYDCKADVFAFGILLWYLCAGSIKAPHTYVHGIPFIALLCRYNPDFIPNVMTEMGIRPEKRDFPQGCYELMTKCWDGNPDNRPTMDKVMDDLTAIYRALSGVQ